MLLQQKGIIVSVGVLSFMYLLFLSGYLPQFSDLKNLSDYVPSFDSEPFASEPPIYDSSASIPALSEPPATSSDSKTLDAPLPDPTAGSGALDWEELGSHEVGTPVAVPGTFEDFHGLPELCQETQWMEGLWLHCHSYCGANKTSVCGGLNNARNRIQTCLRLAIDLGAGIILPSATTRNEDQLLDTDQKTVCPDYFWNVAFLKTEMAVRCPQLQIRDCDDRSGIKHEVLTEKRGYLSFAHHNSSFREHVMGAFENAFVNYPDININNQAVVNFGDSYIGWNYRAAGELYTIRKALFKVLTFNKSLLEISRQILRSPGLEEGNYIGVHLRGEADWPASFGSSDDQMRLYAEEIEKSSVRTVYVSCGDPSAIQRFRDKLTPFGCKVYDKSTLLASNPKSLQKVEALPFDQKAIVEYETLVEAKLFLGVIMSSMSSLIAYAREADHPGNYFMDDVFPGSSRNGLERYYPAPPAMKGNNATMLMVVNGVDIMDYFP